MFSFAEETGIIQQAPKLKRVKNDTRPKAGSKEKPLYTVDDLKRLLKGADPQLKAMIMLALNCGFGPKDIRDLTWGHIDGERVTLPRSKTGICRTYLLWPETLRLLLGIKQQRSKHVLRSTKRAGVRSDNGHVFLTRFRRPWNKDAISEQFRKLCQKAGVPCYGFYRLRHCASTAHRLPISSEVGTTSQVCHLINILETLT